MFWDVEWIIGVVVVASNLLHVENPQDPEESDSIHETFGSLQRIKTGECY